MSSVAVDRLLAAVLLAIGETEVWATNDAGGHRLLAALVAPIVAAALALRRRYPLSAGIAAQTASLVQFTISRDVQIIATSVAWFCALYGLTVWTSRRRFALGAAYVAVSNFLPAIAGYGKPNSIVPFGVVTLVVMLLVRRV
ncbi:MAG TPA: hypothetical protein VIY73_02505, partial [Polyangiaceae bacterium]